MAKRGRPSKSKGLTIKSRETQVFIGFIFIAVGASLFFNNSLTGTIPLLIQAQFGQTTYIIGAMAVVIGLRMIGVKSYITGERFLSGLLILLIAMLPLFTAISDKGDVNLSYVEAYQAKGGGAIGAAIHRWLQGFLGRPGEIGILWATVILAMSIISGISIDQAGEILTTLFGFIGKFFMSIFGAMKRSPSAIKSNESKDQLEIINKKTSNKKDKGMLQNESTLLEMELEAENAMETKIPSGNVADMDLPPLDSDKGPTVKMSFGPDLAGGYKRQSSEDKSKEDTKVSSLEQEFIEKYSPKYKEWKEIPTSLLTAPEEDNFNPEDLKEKSKLIEKTLASFKIQARVAKVFVGPSVVQYALNLAVGTKVSKVKSLARDIGLALAASSDTLRIETIAGTSLVGIEVARKKGKIVRSRELMESSEMSRSSKRIPIALGADIRNDLVAIDLANMPHLLIAGATGTGKSAAINTILIGLLMKFTPDELRLILVDPKMVELEPYNAMPYLLTPVITDMDKVVHALDWALAEMKSRLSLFRETKVRKLDEFNAKSSYKLPLIVIVVDEMADLMMRKKGDVEPKIVRLAQLARATGIHLILATQRPSVGVITGIIKANIPARIALAVTSGVDSRVIIDKQGAETLIGKGDMLVKTPDNAKIRRVQGAFTDTDEVQKVTEHIRKAAKRIDPIEDWYLKSFEEFTEGLASEGEPGNISTKDLSEPQFRQAVNIVIQQKKGSASTLQRSLRVGFNKAARYIDLMEQIGVVGPSRGSRARVVLVSSIDEVDELN